MCIVDYSKISKHQYLFILQKYAYPLGKVVAGFISELNSRLGVQYNDVTLVGHSFGGHMSGIVGTILDGQLGAIFALDPGTILINITSGTFYEYRLSASSAKYVQTIATNKNIFGAFTLLYAGRHVFWVNLGGVLQPGCGPDPAICPHYRSIDYFVHALNPNNVFGANRCGSAGKWLAGGCASSEACNRLGFWANRSGFGNYYLWTNYTPPWARNVACPAADKGKCFLNLT